MADSVRAPRRRLPLQFSLRILLLGFTAFAIGFPIWYRWPYEEVVVRGPSGDPFATFKEFRTHTTWQRQWGGSRLKHGMQRTVRDGITSSIYTFHQDKMHGPFQNYYIGIGRLAEDGQYVDGEKDGIWTNYNEDGSVKATATWQRGQLEGPASISGKSGSHRLTFAAGRVVQVDDQPVKDRLGALVAAGKVDSPSIVEALKRITGVAYIDLPLQSVAESLSQNIRVPIVIDPVHVAPDLRVNCNGQEIDFASCLAVMATLHGLGCDYRYGSIWITSAEDARDWRDPTGVTDIVPAEDSQLATSWNEPVNVLATGQPLADVLNQIVVPLAVDVDVSRIATSSGDEPAYPVTTVVQGQPFRHAVGILLYQTRCRCRLEGETLVILPPE